ncbi:MAG TPA: hypothetical protein VGI83_07590 [Gemmatimonadales bacterium]
MITSSLFLALALVQGHDMHDMPGMHHAAASSKGPDSLLAVVRQTASAFQDTAQARAAGYIPLSIGRVGDRTPFQGEHWLMMPRILRGDSTLTEPPFIMYAQVNGKLSLVGVAYSERIGHEEPTPHGLAGQEAEWHLHQSCLNVPGEGFVLADGVEDCRERGGQPTPKQIAMIHVWSGISSPDGIFAHDNPALPFVAVGLKPPPDSSYMDHDRSEQLRKFALALAETYDSRMPYARRIEMTAHDAAALDSLTAHRAAIAKLIPTLKRAETADDGMAYATAMRRAIAEWASMRATYGRLAQTPEIKKQLDRQYEMAMMGMMQ